MYKFPEPVLNQLRVMYPSAIQIDDSRESLTYVHRDKDSMVAYLDNKTEPTYVMAALSYTQEVEEFPAQAEKLLALYGFTKDLDRLVKQHIERGGRLE